MSASQLVGFTRDLKDAFAYEERVGMIEMLWEVVYADGQLYFRYQDATMALIEATTKDYQLRGSFRLASKLGESWPHPVIHDGKLYIRDQDVLLCYEVRPK